MEMQQPIGKVVGLTEAAHGGGDLAQAATAPSALEFGTGLRTRLERHGIALMWHPAPPNECVPVAPNARYA
jgi:hypothetical protein